MIFLLTAVVINLTEPLTHRMSGQIRRSDTTEKQRIIYQTLQML